MTPAGSLPSQGLFTLLRNGSWGPVLSHRGCRQRPMGPEVPLLADRWDCLVPSPGLAPRSLLSGVIRGAKILEGKGTAPSWTPIHACPAC